MKIAVDMDEVLCAFFEPYLKFYNEKSSTEYKFEDIINFNLWEIVGGTYEDTVKNTYEFYNSEAFKKVPVVPGAKEAITELSSKHSLILVTGRTTDIHDLTIAWLDEHFPEVFESVNFANHWSKHGEQLKKSSFCKQLGAELLIDDCLEYAEDCGSNGIRVLLMDRPWNRVGSLGKNIERVNSWSEIIEKLK